MVDKDLYADTIASLVDYFGGYEALANVLKVNVDDLRHWGEGKGRPPTETFIRIADIKNQAAKNFAEPK